LGQPWDQFFEEEKVRGRSGISGRDQPDPEDTADKDQLDPKDTGRGGLIMIDTETGQVRSGEEIDERAERYEQDNQNRKVP
jgi:hypothetical protein